MFPCHLDGAILATIVLSLEHPVITPLAVCAALVGLDVMDSLERPGGARSAEEFFTSFTDNFTPYECERTRTPKSARAVLLAGGPKSACVVAVELDRCCIVAACTQMMSQAFCCAPAIVSPLSRCYLPPSRRCLGSTVSSFCALPRRDDDPQRRW